MYFTLLAIRTRSPGSQQLLICLNLLLVIFLGPSINLERKVEGEKDVAPEKPYKEELSPLSGALAWLVHRSVHFLPPAP